MICAGRLMCNGRERSGRSGRVMCCDPEPTELVEVGGLLESSEAMAIRLCAMVSGCNEMGRQWQKEELGASGYINAVSN